MSDWQSFTTKAQRESVEGIIAAADALGHEVVNIFQHVPGLDIVIRVSVDNGYDDDPLMVWDVDKGGERWVIS